MSYMEEIHKQAEAIKQRNKDKVRNISANLKEVLDTKAGRAVLMDIIASSGYLNEVDINSAVYAEGRRSLGIQLITAILAVDASKWILMQQEQLNSMTKENK